MQHDFSDLFDQYPALIASMRESTFTIARRRSQYVCAARRWRLVCAGYAESLRKTSLRTVTGGPQSPGGFQACLSLNVRCHA